MLSEWQPYEMTSSSEYAPNLTKCHADEESLRALWKRWRKTHLHTVIAGATSTMLILLRWTLA